MAYLIHIELSSELEDFVILDCKDDEEARTTGFNMAIDMVDSDPELVEEIQTEARQAMEYEGITPNDPSDWLDKVYCDIIIERANVEYWRLKDEVNYDEVLKRTNDYKEIVKEYGI